MSDKQLIYEDELPEGMSEEAYARWFSLSKILDGVRVGPPVKLNEAKQK